MQRKLFANCDYAVIPCIGGPAEYVNTVSIRSKPEDILIHTQSTAVYDKGHSATTRLITYHGKLIYNPTGVCYALYGDLTWDQIPDGIGLNVYAAEVDTGETQFRDQPRTHYVPFLSYTYPNPNYPTFVSSTRVILEATKKYDWTYMPDDLEPVETPATVAHYVDSTYCYYCDGVKSHTAYGINADGSLADPNMLITCPNCGNTLMDGKIYEQLRSRC